MGASQSGILAAHLGGRGDRRRNARFRCQEWLAVDGDVNIDGMVVSLGAYGIAVRITLDVQPTYLVQQRIYLGVPWDVLLSDPRAVLGAAYSVSAFTMWDEPTVEQVWVKRRVGVDPELESSWSDATLLEAGTTTVAGGDPVALTPHLGQPGPWLERLPHFRLEFTPSNGDEIQTEYFVPLDQARAAIAAVRLLGAEIAPHLLITELRTIAASTLWLAGEYQRDTLCIHFTWRNEPDAVASLTPRIESALADFAPRPHWGKVNTMSAEAIATAHPRMSDARALFEHLDPEGMFANAYLQRVGLRSPH